MIWDVDGTMVDSSEYHWQAWRRALAAEGYELSRAEFTRTFGLRNDSILRMLLGADVTPETIRRIEAGKEEDYRRQVRERGIELLPGVARWLERLRADGWRQAVGSSAPQANLDLVLDATHTRKYFDVVVTGGDVAKGKPDPEVFVTAADRLGVEPARCVVVEDAPDAIAGARSAGMWTVGVLGDRQGLGADVESAWLDELPASTFDDLVHT